MEALGCEAGISFGYGPDVQLPTHLISTTSRTDADFQGENNEQSFGTGFFVNIPGSSHDIILTAGHNLMDARGVTTKELKAYVTAAPSRQPPSQSKNNDAQVQTITVDPGAVKINPKFKEDSDTSGENAKINDWGMILIPPSNPKVRRPGFGFNLRLAFQDFGEHQKSLDKFITKEVTRAYIPEMRMGSYRAGDRPGTSIERSGRLATSGEERLRSYQLEYDIVAEEGMSGSPVWMANRGGECVVAIQ